MKKTIQIGALIFLFFSWCGPTHALPLNQNLLITSGKDAFISAGDSLHRSVFYFDVPSTYAGKIYVRVFDADIGAEYDSWQRDSEVLYRIYGKGGVNRQIRSITDDLSDEKAIIELKLGQSRYYNKQWRTIAELNTGQGEPLDSMAHFQLVVDGVKGQASNKYQVFISSEDKKNTAIENARLYTPVINLNIPPGPGKMTQVRFRIPSDAQFLDISNFDVDAIEYGAKLYFSTSARAAIPLEASRNSETSTTRIALEREERGQTGAILFTSEAPNNLQLWIHDDQERSVPIELPPFMAPRNHLPEPRISAVPLSECDAILLDATQSEDPDNDELTFEWFFEDGSSQTGARIVHDFKKAGQYEVTLKASDNSGFVANSAQITQPIRINARPQGHIEAPSKAMPVQRVTFSAADSTDADGQIIRYLWNFGDGAKAAGSVVKHRFQRPGVYQVVLTVEDDSQSLCSRSKTVQEVWVNAPPVTRLNLPSIAAIDQDVALNAQGSIDSDGRIVHYQWYFGDGDTGEGPDVIHSWSQPGVYTVQLCVTDDADLENSVTTEEAKIVINAPPVPKIKARDVIAANEIVEFDASASVDADGTITQYRWEMGDGISKQGVKITHAYTSPGVYEPKLTVIDDSGVGNDRTSTQKSVRVNHPPVPQAGEDRVVNTSVVAFNASDSTDTDDEIIAYTWDFGDNQTAQGARVEHVYAMPGRYTVTLTVTDASGTVSASQSDSALITVNHPPVADAGMDLTIPVGGMVDLDAGFCDDPDGEIVSYEWLVQGRSLTGRQVEHQFDQYGQYQVGVVIKDNDGAMAVDYATITVNAAPVPVFSPIKRVAPGQAVVFDASASHDPDGKITRFEWEFGDGSEIQAGSQVEHAFEKPGRYQVVLAVQDDTQASNNSAVQIKIVEVNYPPKADAGADIRTCRQKVWFDGAASSDADGDHLNWHWDFGDETTGRGVNAWHHYADPGAYPVTLTVDDGTGLDNASAQAKITVYVNAPPTASIQVNSQTVCAGDLVLFDASQSADPEKGVLRYEWSLGDGVTAQGVNPVRDYKKGGDYKIELTVYDDTDLPCNSTQTAMMIHVVDAPIAVAGEDQHVCANTLVAFDGSASSGGGRRIKSYEWDFGDGAAGVGAEIKHAYTHPGTYPARLVIITDGAGDCKNTSQDEVMITVSEAPSAVFDAPEEGCVDTPITFDAGESTSADASIVSYQWDFGDNAAAEGPTASHQYKEPGEYTVKLRIETDSDQDCNTAELVKTMRINAAPQAVIQAAAGEERLETKQSERFYVNEMARFSARASQDADGHLQTYLWDFGDGQTAQGFTVNHQFNQAGDYPVILTVTDNSQTTCNKATARLRAQVMDPPRLAIQGPGQGCAGQPMELALPDADESVQWFFNLRESTAPAAASTTEPDASASGAVLAEGNPVSQVFDHPGVYQVQARWQDQLSLAKQVRIHALPAMQLPSQVEIFQGDRLILKPVYNRLNPTPLVFQWDMGDDTRMDAERADHVYAQAGAYDARLTVTGKEGPDCLRAVYPVSVKVHEPPQVKMRITHPDAGETLYTGGARDRLRFSVEVTNGDAPWNFAWDFGDGLKMPGARLTHAYTKPGVYKVVLTLSDALKRTPQVFEFVRQIEVVRRK